MTDIIAALGIDMIQNMFLATIISGVVCGAVGLFVVVKRITFVCDGIAHAAFGGVGLAYFAQSVLLASWFSPILGAAVVGVAVALILAAPKVSGKLREDSVIGAVMASGMAMGALFIALSDPSKVLIKSYESILFGNVLLVSSDMVLVMAIVSAIILALLAYFYRDLQVLTFDEDLARISGMKVPLMNAVLYCIVAAVCVMVMNVIGIMMVLALIAVPPAMSMMFAGDMKRAIGLSVALAVSLSTMGLMLSIVFDRIPPGAMVVIVLATAFILSYAVAHLRGGARGNRTGAR